MKQIRVTSFLFSILLQCVIRIWLFCERAVNWIDNLGLPLRDKFIEIEEDRIHCNFINFGTKTKAIDRKMQVANILRDLISRCNLNM